MINHTVAGNGGLRGGDLNTFACVLSGDWRDLGGLGARAGWKWRHIDRTILLSYYHTILLHYFTTIMLK